MPRVNKVKKSAKDQGQCGRCGTLLPQGSAYVWWKFRFGGKYKRCTDEACYPSRSALTNSEILSNAWDLCDDFDASGYEDLNSLCERASEIAQQVEDDIVQLIQEKLDAIEDGMGHCEVPIYGELEERMGEYENWQCEIQCAHEEFEGVEPDEDDEDETEEAILERAQQAIQGAVDACPE